MGGSESTQLACELIETLRERGMKPSSSLLLVAARASFCGLSGRQSEFETALRAAMHKGWLELSEDGQWVALTTRAPLTDAH